MRATLDEGARTCSTHLLAVLGLSVAVHTNFQMSTDNCYLPQTDQRVPESYLSGAAACSELYGSGSTMLRAACCRPRSFLCRRRRASDARYGSPMEQDGVFKQVNHLAHTWL